MPKLFWLLLQGAVIALALFIDWRVSQSSGNPPAPGLALLLGVGAAILLTTAGGRLLDGFRYGWKASEPAGALVSTLRAVLAICGAVAITWGLGLAIGNGSNAETQTPGALLMAGGIVLLSIAALWPWIVRKRSPVPGAVVITAARAGRLPPLIGDIREPNEIEGGISAGLGSRRELPKMCGGLGQR